MAYTTYEFYANCFMGDSVPVDDFPRLAERASDYIDYITMGRATCNSVDVQKACCAIAEQLYVVDRAKTASLTESGELASQTVGAWSKTYRSGAESAKAYEDQVFNIAQRYLLKTGLLYRGGVRCSHTL